MGSQPYTTSLATKRRPRQSTGTSESGHRASKTIPNRTNFLAATPRATDASTLAQCCTRLGGRETVAFSASLVALVGRNPEFSPIVLNLYRWVEVEPVDFFVAGSGPCPCVLLTTDSPSTLPLLYPSSSKNHPVILHLILSFFHSPYHFSSASPSPPIPFSPITLKLSRPSF